jgi:hypothetical protein
MSEQIALKSEHDPYLYQSLGTLSDSAFRFPGKPPLEPHQHAHQTLHVYISLETPNGILAYISIVTL